MHWVKRSTEHRPKRYENEFPAEPALVIEIEARRRRAEMTLAAGTSDGSSDPKALEGEVAALSEVLRAVFAAVAGGADPTTLTSTVVPEVHGRWVDELEGHEAGGAPEHWLAYDRGGVAALDALLPRASRSGTTTLSR